MSQENVELVQSMYRPGDPSRFFDLLYEEVEAEFDPTASPLLPDYPQRIDGKTAVVDFYRHYWGTLGGLCPAAHRDHRCRRGPRCRRPPRARRREGKRGAV